MYFLFKCCFLYLFCILVLCIIKKIKKELCTLKILLEALIDFVVSQVLVLLIVKFSMKMSFHHIFKDLFFKAQAGFMIKYTLIAALILTICILIRKFILSTKEVQKRERPYKKNIIFSSILISLFAFSVMILVYLAYFFPNLRIDQILFTIKTPLKGTSFWVLAGFIILVLCIPVSIFLINYLNLRRGREIYFRIAKLRFRALPHNFRYCKTILFIFLIAFIMLFYIKLDAGDFIRYSLKEDDTFYEENYIDPKNINFKFPKKKKNLILVYLESFEVETSKYARKGTNIIPELTELANKNISFSHNDGLGGQRQLYGTSFSLACLCCTQLGLPLTIPVQVKNVQSAEDFFKFNDYELSRHFFNNVYGLGDLLEDNGYNLSFLMGADAEFGSLGKLLRTHGNFKIKDINYFKEIGKVPQDYFVWWGIEDDKIVEFSKEELLNLHKEDKPFLFSVFLEDTHATGGYIAPECEEKYPAKIHNAFSEMSKRVANFISWIEKQEFYEDSVIVLLGDHLYMGGDLYEVKNVDRHAYNCFINTKNSSFSSENIKNRDFASFDYFPTIVDCLGIKYDADGLGLGRSLFSGNKTLLEEHGHEEITEKIMSKSKMYRNLLLDQ